MLFVDWLGLSLQLSSMPVDIPDHQWRQYSATKVWSERWILYTDEGDKVLTLLFKPRACKEDGGRGFLAANAALLEIENQWLYHGGGVDRILDLLAQSCWYHITGVSRVDLCADFCPTYAQRDVIMGLSTKSMYVVKKQNRTEFCSVNHSEKLHPMWRELSIPHQQSWGHKTSDIKWKLYYKTKELWDDGGGKFMVKPYIVDQWRIHGLDITNVWRLEVSIKHGNGFIFGGKPLSLATVRESRSLLYKSLYMDLFKIRLNEHHKDKSNDTEVHFLDIEKVNHHMINRPPRGMREHYGRISLLRSLVKSLNDEHVLLDRESRNDVLDHIGKIIRRDGLMNYFYGMVGMWFEEFRDDTEKFACQRWAVRDALAESSHREKGVSTDAERSYNIPHPEKYYTIPMNTHFDDDKTDAEAEYYRHLWQGYREKIDELGSNYDWGGLFGAQKLP